MMHIMVTVTCFLTWVFSGMFSGMLASLPLLGQVADAPVTKKWVAMVIALVLIVGVVVAATVTPKRDHRD